MMKKSDFDFSIPNRQSYVAIIMILFKTVNIVVRQLFPVLLVVLVGGSKNRGDYLLWFVIAASSLSMIYSIINFFRTYFIIQGNELVLYTGILNKKKLSIPFERIQTINFEQNIIHQFFSVLRMKVDTAGSEKNEFEFHALEAQKAYALRDIILAEKKSIPPVISNSSNETLKTEFTQIMSLSQTQLLKVGITQNHIKSGGLIFLFFFWIYQNLQEVGVDVDEYSEELPEWEMGFYVVMSLLTIFVIISVLISLIRTLIKHYDLRFLRSDRGFKVISGLFTKREISAFDHKIQHISWSDNLLKRWVGYKDLSLNQASSNELTAKQNIHIPGCNLDHIQQVTSSLFGQSDFDSIKMNGIDKKYFIRYAFIFSLLLVTVTIVAIIMNQTPKVPYVLLAGFYFIVTRYISFRKKSFGFNDELIYIKGGIFGDKTEVMPMFKIQALEIQQSPYQAKHCLASITLYTASGKLKIPYIALSSCRQLADLLLYKAESSNRKWM